jgi:hypothetical protein
MITSTTAPPTFSKGSMAKPSLGPTEREEDLFEQEKDVMKNCGSDMIGERENHVRKRWNDIKIPSLTMVEIDFKNRRPPLRQNTPKKKKVTGIRNSYIHLHNPLRYV